MTFYNRLRSFVIALSIFTALVVLPHRAGAQANTTFSGAMGGPLRLTLNAPVTYLITTAATNSRFYFDLQNVGGFFTGGLPVTGTITYSINNGTPITINYLGNSIGMGTVSTNDLTLFNLNAANTVMIGDTVRLLAGTLTSTSNGSGAPPASGTYQTFVTDVNGTRLDALNGVSVPEPSAWALLGVSAAGLGLGLRRRVRPV